MNKKTIKIISILAVILCVIMAMTTCFALEANEIQPSSSAGNYGLGTIGSNIATVIRNVGVVVAVIILMVIGIKYMLGSAEEKAEYKKVFVPYVIGAVLLFAASAIAQVVVTFSESVGDNVETGSIMQELQIAMNYLKLI